MIREAIKDIIDKLLDYTKHNTGKFMGTVIGLIIAIMMLLLGFFKTIFILLCASLGYVIGSKIDEGESLKSLFLKILSLKD